MRHDVPARVGPVTRRLAAAAVAVAVLASLVVAGTAAPAGAASRCHTGADANLGPFLYRPITASNGSNTYVENNMWGVGGHPGARQQVCARSPGHWHVRVRMPRGNTAVLTYPNVAQLLTGTSEVGQAVSRWTRITSRYAERGPAARVRGDWEAAYDIWSSRTGGGPDEIMIWVDNHGQTPAGHVTAHARVYGQRWAVWSGDGPVSLVLGHRQRAGVVHILALLRWLVAHRYMRGSATVDQVQFGWELCSTGGKWRVFRVTRYNLITRHRLAERGLGVGQAVGGGAEHPARVLVVPAVQPRAVDGIGQPLGALGHLGRAAHGGLGFAERGERLGLGRVRAV